MEVLESVGEVAVVIAFSAGRWPHVGPGVEFEGEARLPEAVRERARDGQRENRLDGSDDHGGDGVLLGEGHDGWVAAHAPGVEDAAVEEGEARREHRHQEGEEGRHIAGSHVLVAPVHVGLWVFVHEQGASSAHVLPADGDLGHGNGDHHRRGHDDDVDHDAEDL